MRITLQRLLMEIVQQAAAVVRSVPEDFGWQVAIQSSLEIILHAERWLSVEINRRA
jgi:hypothetical protein